VGSVQSNLLLHTVQGKWVLRYYKRDRSFNAVLFEVNLIAYLGRKGYPCPAVVRDSHGKLAGLYRDKAYALFEFLEGKYVESPTAAQKRQVIRYVAELHNLTRRYRPAYMKYRWNYGVELCGALAEKATRTIATTNAEEKLLWHRQELAKLTLPISLAKGVCHADFHFSNVLFKEDSFHALLDFDDANYTFLTFDLASLIEPELFRFRWDTWQHVAPEDEVFDFTEVRHIVSTYQQYRVLNASEKKYLFDVLKLVILLDCIWYFKRGSAHDFYEKRKIEYLNKLGRETFAHKLFTEIT
jgi:Ser/Thr protein kinase RdoA (MazF antagonist)